MEPVGPFHEVSVERAQTSGFAQCVCLDTGSSLADLFPGRNHTKEQAGQHCASRVFALIILSRFLVSPIVPLGGTLWKTSRGLSGLAALFLESMPKIEHLDIENPRELKETSRATADHSYVGSLSVVGP